MTDKKRTEHEQRILKDSSEFVAWLQETLIPDLKDSGMDATAEDFEKMIDFVQALKCMLPQSE